MPPNPIPSFLPLTGLYEPSAIQQFADERFLLVEDEKQHSFSLVTPSAGGLVKARSLGPGWFPTSHSFWKLDDLKGHALVRLPVKKAAIFFLQLSQR